MVKDGGRQAVDIFLRIPREFSSAVHSGQLVSACPIPTFFIVKAFRFSRVTSSFPLSPHHLREENTTQFWSESTLYSAEGDAILEVWVEMLSVH